MACLTWLIQLDNDIVIVHSLQYSIYSTSYTAVYYPIKEVLRYVVSVGVCVCLHDFCVYSLTCISETAGNREHL